MSLEYDLTIGVNKHDVWNTSDSILLAAIRLGSVVMDRTIPIFCINMLNDCLCSLIDTDTNNLNLFSPISSSLFEHFLVVSHWCLAWWAPSSPEINEPNFTLFMLESDWFTTLYWYDILDWIILATSTQLDITINLDAFDTFNNSIDILLECINLLFHIRFEIL